MRSAVSMLAHYDPESEENTAIAHQHKACRLLGQISGVLAALERIRRGEEPVKPRMDLDHAANFLWMLSGEDPDPLAAKALDQYLLLLAEHELNASTFSARVTASTESDLHSAITSAVGTLKGQADTKEREGITVPILVTGTFSSPSFAPDMKGVLEKTIQDRLLAPKDASQGGQPTQEKAKDILKSLPFGKQ